MKAYELLQPGIDGLAIAERPEPRPGPGQILIKVEAVSLNYRDLRVIQGTYSRSMPQNLVPCSDGAGTVVEIGPGVTRVQAGDRVAGIFMQTWISGSIDDEKGRSAMGGAIDGMLQEYVVLHQDGVVLAPAHLSSIEAATLPCAAVTAWHALITSGKLQAGETVLTLGTGGVSVFAAQFAHLTGARVIGTSSSDAKLARLRDELGVKDSINYRATPDWDKSVKQMTGGIGVDHVVEVGGAGTLGRSLRAVRTGGSVALIGLLAETGEFNPTAILMRSVRVQGIYVGSRDMFEAMNRAITQHQLRPVVDRVFPFEAARDALRHMESGSHFGKICIQLA